MHVYLSNGNRLCNAVILITRTCGSTAVLYLGDLSRKGRRNEGHDEAHTEEMAWNGNLDSAAARLLRPRARLARKSDKEMWQFTCLLDIVFFSLEP